MRCGYSTTPRRKNTTLSRSIVAIDLNINTTAVYSWFENHALYLVGDQKGLVYYELLKPGDSITGDRYWLQLIRLSRALREKRPENEQMVHDKVIFLHDNAWPHVAKVIKKYLETLKWNVLLHPPYSPDIAPSDYWLFRRMQQVTGSLLSQKSKIGSPPKTSFSFFRDGIRKLLERWEKVVGSRQ